MREQGLLVLILLAGIGTTAADDWHNYAQEWLGSQQQYDGSYREQYYPYFGEDFFTSGSNRYQSSPESIAAQRWLFEEPFLPYFGDAFLYNGEPYRFTYPGPWGVFPITPEDYFTYPYESRPIMAWPAFSKNWTATMNYAKARSSFRIYNGAGWITA